MLYQLNCKISVTAKVLYCIILRHREKDVYEESQKHLLYILLYNEMCVIISLLK